MLRIFVREWGLAENRIDALAGCFASGIVPLCWGEEFALQSGDTPN